MIIQLMGPQACGKGTQGQLLSEKLNLPLIGVGDILRDLPSSDPKFKTLHEQMDRGDLVDVPTLAKLLLERISKPDCKNGYILDGWMRELSQLNFFDPHPDWVIEIVIPREESIRRITGRRICEENGEVYNIYTLPAEELAKCPGPLIQREDDTEEAVTHRLNIYYTDTIKVIEKYRSENKLIEIDGIGSPEQIFSRILLALETAEKLRIIINL